MDGEQLAAAGRLVTQRITERGKTAADVARAARVDPKTLRALMTGTRWPARAIAQIEAALDWAPGEVFRRTADGIDTLACYTDRELLHELVSRARRRDPGNNHRRAC